MDCLDGLFGKGNAMKALIESLGLVMVLTVATAALLFASCDQDGDSGEDEGPEGGDVYDGGQPNKLKRPDHPDSTLEIKFIVAGDPQFTDTGYESDRMARQRTVANEIDSVENGDNVMGIVMVGDLVNSDEYYHTTAFRQVYENDYPGEDPGCIWGDCWMTDVMEKYYSGNAQIDTAVYPLLGNHDENKEEDSGEDSFAWNYVAERMGSSEALYDGKTDQNEQISNWHGPNLYAWEWGSYHFIAMGLWAFSDEFSKTGIEQGKVDWLKDHLAQVGKEKPIIMFQHYGFDATSWWPDEGRELLKNVICDSDDYTSSCEAPYNVIVLFSGHTHKFDEPRQDILHWHGPREIPNLTVDDAGFAGEDTDPDDHAQGAGFFYIEIEMNDDNETATMTVDRRVFDGKGITRDFGDPHGDGKTYIELGNTSGGWYLYWDKDYKQIEFTPSLMRFRQGEPSNGGGNEDCAVMKPWGRYNDYICKKKRRILCFDKKNGDWHVSGGTYEWHKAFRMCEQSGWVFSDPKNVTEQAEVIDLMREGGVSEMWVNYTDLLLEGKWQEGPEFLKYFSPSEPNNGDQFFEQGWGQNCAAIYNKDNNGLVHDVNCEMNLDKYFCFDGANSYIATKTGPWVKGYDHCDAESDYALSANGADLQTAVDAAEAYWTENPNDTGPIWVGFYDLHEEGDWEGNVPWIVNNPDTGKPGGWKPSPWGQPDGGHSQNCVVAMNDGWHDTKCDETQGPWPFACRNYQTGEWTLSTTESKSWNDGFQACRDEGLRYHFACPIRKDDNDTVVGLMAEDRTAAWLNYTDASGDGGQDFEGHWRHGYWKNWYPGQPDNGGGNENCILSMAGRDGGMWADRDCDSHYAVLCRTDEPAIYAGTWHGIGSRKYHDAQAGCAGYDGSKFSYPTCPSEQEQVNKVDFGDFSFWIQLNDELLEGMFQPW